MVLRTQDWTLSACLLAGEWKKGKFVEKRLLTRPCLSKLRINIPVLIVQMNKNQEIWLSNQVDPSFQEHENTKNSLLCWCCFPLVVVSPSLTMTLSVAYDLRVLYKSLWCVPPVSVYLRKTKCFTAHKQDCSMRAWGGSNGEERNSVINVIYQTLQGVGSAWVLSNRQGQCYFSPPISLLRSYVWLTRTS